MNDELPYGLNVDSKVLVLMEREETGSYLSLTWNNSIYNRETKEYNKQELENMFEELVTPQLKNGFQILEVFSK